MKVGVHQGSARVHFYIKVLIEDVRYGSLIELLYAEDLVLFGESLNKWGYGQVSEMEKCSRRRRVWGWMLIKQKYAVIEKKSSISKIDTWFVTGRLQIYSVYEISEVGSSLLFWYALFCEVF